MIKAIIFDCFGVIITDALQQVREEVRQYNPEGAKEIENIVRAANLGLMSPSEGSERVAMILGVTADAYRARIVQGEVKNHALLDYIFALKRSYKTAMLSNIPGPSLTKRFTVEELRSHFDVVVASGDIGYAKPEPEAYEITAERLGVRCDECVFIDDRELFCEGANSVGMRSIAYTDFAQFRASLNALLVAAV